MKLCVEKLRKITLGSVEIEETEKGISFHRFSKIQREMYKVRSADFYKKVFAPSGVKLSFRTDSEFLFVKGEACPSSSRKYYSLDLFIDGEKKDSFDNFSQETEAPSTTGEYPLGCFEKHFDLGEGVKEVVLCMPWSVQVAFSEIAVSDGAFLEAVKPEKKMLVFGDSITHGYDAACTSNSYISRLSRYLKAEEYNKAIGGEVFWPELADTDEPFEPDFITVAYGTNDWSKSASLEQFQANSKGFYENLARRYPSVPIFAISPIWRAAYKMEKPCGDFRNVHNFFVQIAENIPNMIVIDGWEFVPQNPDLFADKTLHPNDAGFDFYAKGLYEEMKKYL